MPICSDFEIDFAVTCLGEDLGMHLGCALAVAEFVRDAHSL